MSFNDSNLSVCELQLYIPDALPEIPALCTLPTTALPLLAGGDGKLGISSNVAMEYSTLGV